MAEKNTYIDMTSAKTFENVPDKVKCLVAIKKWEQGESQASGEAKVHVEMVVLEPEKYKGRIFFDDINLKNEFTLGRLLDMLVAMGYKEEEIRVKKFSLPLKEDMEGQQLTVTSRVIKAEPGSEFGDKTVATRFRPADAYKGAENA